MDIRNLMAQANITVRYHNGFTKAIAKGLTAQQAQQVIDRVMPKVTEIFGIKRLTLDGYTGKYVVSSENGREMSGFARTPFEALSETWAFCCGLRSFVEVGR